MPKFVLIYRGGNPPATPEEGKAHMAAWFQWTKDHGTALVEPNNPLTGWKSVTAAGVADTAPAFMGYSVAEVANEAAALEIAQSCPFLKTGGTIEVALIKDMPA